MNNTDYTKLLSTTDVMKTAINLDRIENMTGRRVDPILGADVTKTMSTTDVMTTAINLDRIERMRARNLTHGDAEFALIAAAIGVAIFIIAGILTSI